jgi:hypothetical protein
MDSLEHYIQKFEIQSPVRFIPNAKWCYPETDACRFFDGEYQISGEKRVLHELGHIKSAELGFPNLDGRPIQIYSLEGQLKRSAVLHSFTALTHPIVWRLFEQYGMKEQIKPDIGFNLPEFEEDLCLNMMGFDNLSQSNVDILGKSYSLSLLQYDLANEKYALELNDKFIPNKQLLSSLWKSTNEFISRMSPLVRKYFSSPFTDLIREIEQDFKGLVREVGTEVSIEKREHITKNGNKIKGWFVNF